MRIGDRRASREVVASELKSASKSATGNHYWAFYAEWCAVNGQSELPPQDAPVSVGGDMLLVFLQHQVDTRDWSGGYAQQVGGYVARQFVAAGCPDPRSSGGWPRWVKWAKKRKGGEAKVDAMTEDQVIGVREAVHSARSPHLILGSLEVAAAFAIADALRLPGESVLATGTGSVARIPKEFLERRDNSSIVVRHGDSRALVLSSTAPHHFRVLSQLLELSDGHHRPLSSSGVKAATRASKMRDARLRVPGVTAVGVGPRNRSATISSAAFADWFENASRTDRQWLIRYAENPKLRRDTRDVAWFFTALTFGGRANEVNALRYRHIVQNDAAGYVFSLAPHEHKGGRITQSRGGTGTALVAEVPHIVGPLSDNRQSHVPHCPACILDDHLEIEASFTEPDPNKRIFTSMKGAPLTTAASRLMIIRLWSCVEQLITDPHLRRVSSRTVRMTTATLARAKGLTLVEIADLLHHENLSTTVGYIRRNDVYASSDLVLGLGTAQSENTDT